MRKPIIRIACFVAVLMLVLIWVNNVFSFKYSNGIAQVKDFYELEENTVDVLIVGSSHAIYNYNNGTLWDDYGIASYDLGGASQMLWNSYYYIKEALKTQKPELIVLDVYSVIWEDDYSDEGHAVRNTFGFRNSMDKINNSMVSFPKEKMVDALLEYPYYHVRYRELDRGDFLDIPNRFDDIYDWFGDDWKGQFLLCVGNHTEFADVSSVNYRTELNPKVNEYYHRIINLSKEENIPLLLVVTPFSPSELQQSKILEAKFIANDMGIPFLNMNEKMDEIGFDYERDFYDDGHMTVGGSAKYSRYFGELVKEQYDISDRRGNERYITWDKWAEKSRTFEKDAAFQGRYDLDIVNEYLQDEGKLIFVSINGTVDASIYDFLAKTGCFGGSVDEETECWIKNSGETYCKPCEKNKDYFISTESHDFYVCDEIEGNVISVDNIQHGQKVQNGINFVVFDTITNALIDEFGIDADNGMMIVR